MATPLTDENAAKFLQPVVDDILTQVRGLVDPLRTEVAALKAAPAPAAPADTKPEETTAPAAGIPEGVDPTDPASVAQYHARLEASKVDWNDPAAVEAYQQKLTAGSGGGGTPQASEGGDESVEAEKAKLEAKIAQLTAEKAALEKRSNQAGDGVVTVPGQKGPDKIDTFEAGHLLGDAINKLHGRKEN